MAGGWVHHAPLSSKLIITAFIPLFLNSPQFQPPRATRSMMGGGGGPGLHYTLCHAKTCLKTG